MKCSSCQRDISEDFKLCPYCGQPVPPVEIESEKSRQSADALKAQRIKEELEQQLNNNQTVPPQPEELDFDDEDEPKEKIRAGVKRIKPKASGKKTVFITLFMLVIVLSGVAAFFLLNNKALIQTVKQIEAGDTADVLNLVSLSKKNEDKYTYEVAENNIKADVPGKYSVTYNLIDKNSEKKAISFEFEVVDTTAPDIKADDSIQTTVGKEFNVIEYLIVSDIVDGVIDPKNVKAEGDIDTDKVGTYPLTLSVTDKAGNKTTKSINVSVVDKGDPNVFIDNISGQWHNSSTKIVAKFSVKNGVYQLDIGYYQSEGFGTGILTFIDVNGDNTVANFTWDFKSYYMDDSNQIKYSDVQKKTVVVDTGVPKDDKITIDLGDENGPQEYDFLSD